MITEFDQSRDFDVGLSSDQVIEITPETGVQIDVSFSGDEEASFDLNGDSEFIVDFGNAAGEDDYQGPYTVTPGTQAKTLQTAEKRLTQNIVVNPIPSNYGLKTWNGSVLTVS